MLGRLVCLDHQVQKAVEGCQDQKETKEDLVQQVVPVNLVELVYQD